MKRLGVMLATALISCGPPAQSQDEATITWRLSYTQSQQVQTRVTFPLPLVNGVAAHQPDQLLVEDGGTVALSQTSVGQGMGLDALGNAEASFFAKTVKGLGGGTGAPDVHLSMQQPDGGPGALYVHVNKSGAASINIEFEYTAERNCGNGCGGKKSWKFTGPVGLALQPVHMDYVEEKR